MNTYPSLLNFSNLFVPAAGVATTEELVRAYQEGRQTEVIAHVFCTNYQLFRLTANKFFGLSAEDKDSFILEEIAKALENYDLQSEKQAKITTVISTYIYNRLRTETQALQKASRATLNLATSFEDLGDMERLEEAGDESTYSYSEMYELVCQLDLTENERKCCEIIILNNDTLKNSEIAELLGVSRAGVGHIKKSLKVKLAPIFHIAI